MRLLLENNAVKISKVAYLLICEFKVGHLDSSSWQEIQDARISVVEPTTFPTLFNISSLYQIDKETRDLLALDGSFQGIQSLALLYDNPVSRMIGSVFLGHAQSHFPTEMFDKESEAMEWLRKNITDFPEGNM